jgi:catechol 2,3-dioxygenase-like lactoylglutathione lyase family enzyme
MKRLHVHVSVDDLAQSTRFYSTLFAAAPTVVKDDYVKWMLDDPRVNFAISTSGGDHTGNVDVGDRAARRRTAGISHLGIQVEDETELAEVYERLTRAERPTVEAKNAACCYHKSDKQWIADPQGVPWEAFYTYGESTVYGEGSLAKLKEVSEAACCTPTCCEPEAIQTPRPAAAAACCAR